MPRLLAPDGSKNLIGSRVRDLRTQRGLSQEELMAQLQLLGFDSERGVIKRIENGDRFVSDVEVKILSQFFGVTSQYLIDGSEPHKSIHK